MGGRSGWMRFGALGVVALFGVLSSVTSVVAKTDGFNTPGNILISDQFNNRVIEIDRQKHIVWQWGVGPNDLTASSIIGVNDAQRVGDLTLLAGTGIPPNTVPNCPVATHPLGCPDNRVLLVDRSGKIVWQYGHFGPGSSATGYLNTPVQNTYLSNGDILITDQANARVIEVNHDKEIVWQYGHTGTTGTADNYLNNPNSAERLANGHILISDENNNRAIEVSRAKHIVHVFSAGGTTTGGVAFASRLPNGDTLLTDSGNSRIVEVNASDVPVWHYFTNTSPKSNASPLPTRAVRESNGDTLISDQFNQRVIEIDSSGNIVFSKGILNQAGFGGGKLNGPYDAKVIGDFTGLTPSGDNID